RGSPPAQGTPAPAGLSGEKSGSPSRTPSDESTDGAGSDTLPAAEATPTDTTRAAESEAKERRRRRVSVMAAAGGRGRGGGPTPGTSRPPRRGGGGARAAPWASAPWRA